MNADRVDVLRRELTMSEMLAKVFLNLPTREDMERIAALEPQDLAGSASGDMLAQFVNECRIRSIDDVLLDVARERVAFVRGTGAGNIDPPYESLYTQSIRSEVIASLNRFYIECEVHKVDDVRDAADQIGVEFAFLSTLARRELGQLDVGQLEQAEQTDAAIERFRAEHLFYWAGSYAQQLVDNARSPYWKAIGMFIQEAAEIRG